MQCLETGTGKRKKEPQKIYNKITRSKLSFNGRKRLQKKGEERTFCKKFDSKDGPILVNSRKTVQFSVILEENQKL